MNNQRSAIGGQGYSDMAPGGGFAAQRDEYRGPIGASAGETTAPRPMMIQEAVAAAVMDECGRLEDIATRLGVMAEMFTGARPEPAQAGGDKRNESRQAVGANAMALGALDRLQRVGTALDMRLVALSEALRGGQ
jgi:hypothetical protein